MMSGNQGVKEHYTRQPYYLAAGRAHRSRPVWGRLRGMGMPRQRAYEALDMLKNLETADQLTVGI